MQIAAAALAPSLLQAFVKLLRFPHYQPAILQVRYEHLDGFDFVRCCKEISPHAVD